MIITCDDGSTRWLNHNGECHRINGPAIIYQDGAHAWYHHNNLHRIDGPAFIHPNGIKLWFLNGVQYSELEFNFWSGLTSI